MGKKKRAAKRKKPSRRRPAPTEWQQQVIDSVNYWWKEHGYGPSFGDLAYYHQCSRSNVYYTCMRMKHTGHLKWTEGVSRTIKVIP